MVRHVVRRCCKTFAVVGLTLAASFAIMPAVVATAATEEASATTQASSDYTYADGLAGFFRSIGDTTSASMVESLSGVKGSAAHTYYDNALDNIEDTTSALNLDSVKEAIEILETCNELRSKAGLSQLKVNTNLMALSAISATYAANHGMVSNNHQVTADNNLGENLAWNSFSNGASYAFVQWYDDEKAYFDEATRALYGTTVAPGKAYEFSQQEGRRSKIDDWIESKYGQSASVGHYLNIVDPTYGVMGASTVDRLPGQFGNTFEQSFQFSSYAGGQTMTVSEFKSKFNEYYNEMQSTRYFTVTVPEIEHGTLSIGTFRAKAGQQVNISLWPDIGYIGSLSAKAASGERIHQNNWSVSFPFQRGTTYGFVMPASDVTILASVEERMIGITIQQPEHGTISVDQTSVREGDTFTITFTPDPGYGFSSYFVDHGPEMHSSGGGFDTEKTGGKTVTATETSEPLHMTISATMYKLDGDTQPISISSSENVNVVGPSVALPGDTVNLSIVAEDGYEIKSVTAKDAEGHTVALTQKDGTWSFTMPNTAISIVPEVVKTSFSINTSQVSDAKVTFDRQDAQVGDTVSVTVEPEEGKRVSKVYIIDESGKEIELYVYLLNRWSFQMPASSVSVRVELVDGDAPVVTFPDVHESDWYYEPVAWAVESGAMSGYGNGSFGPLGTLTRGQVATILHNLAGKPAADGSAVGEDFSDCSPEDFYAEAVAWAVDEGIFSGYANGTFGPSAPMSREQLCVVLWRMQGEPESFQSLKRFPDAYDLSPFAEAAVRWAVEEGLLQGNGQGMLNPVGALNRAEGAAILMRYTEKFGK